MGKSQSKLAPAQLSYLEKQTYFTRSELRKWYKGFTKDCPDGRLDQDEFSRIYKQFFPSGYPSDFSTYMFGLFDTNNDGFIDFEEFITALSVTGRGSFDEKTTWAFKLYDIDKDGVISRAEMLQIVQSIYKMTGGVIKLPPDEDTPEKRTDKIFRMMDMDNNGTLSYEKFAEGSKRDPHIMKAISLYDGLL